MGPVPEEDAIATVHASIEAGATFIDTAEGYRTSEAVLGKALRGRRHDVFLATKVSGDQSRSHITTALENSLRALGTDFVDLYQLHGPRPQWPIAETMAILLEARAAGKIRYIGISNFSSEQTVEALRFGPIHSSQPRYNMLAREVEETILPTCLENGVGVIAHTPLAKGLLSGRYRPGHTFSDDDERSRHSVTSAESLEKAAIVSSRLGSFAADHGRSLAELAIAWTLAHPAITSSIVGAKTPEQARANAAASTWKLSQDDLGEIDRLIATEGDA